MTTPENGPYIISAAHLDWADSRPGGHHRQPPDRPGRVPYGIGIELTASSVRLPPPELCYADHLARRRSAAGRWRKRRDPGAGYSAFWVALALLGLLECWALVMVTP